MSYRANEKTAFMTRLSAFLACAPSSVKNAMTP